MKDQLASQRGIQQELKTKKNIYKFFLATKLKVGSINGDIPKTRIEKRELDKKEKKLGQAVLKSFYFEKK